MNLPAAQGTVVAVALLGLFALPATAVAQSVQGFVEVRGTANIGVEGKWWHLVERARPTFKAPIGDRIRLVTTIEFALGQGRTLQDEFERTLMDSDFGELLELADCTWPRHNSRMLHIDDVDDYLDVDRLYIDFYLPFMDLRVGRQALHWGSSPFLNPTDPFPEVLLAEPWRPRRGVNAIRATIPITSGSDFTAALAATDLFDALRAAGRLRVQWGPTDFAIVAAWRGDTFESGGKGSSLWGFDLRGTLGVGYWLEAAMFARDAELTQQLTVGIDYSFPVLDNLIVMAQYHHNSAGSAEPDNDSALGGMGDVIQAPDCAVGDAAELLGAGGEGTADPFAPTLSGRDYLMVSLSQVFMPELTLNLVALQNLGDGTGYFMPTVSARPLGWLEISMAAQLPYRLWGDGGEFKPDEDDLQISEDLGPLFGVREADFSGLLPDATVTLWTRVSF